MDAVPTVDTRAALLDAAEALFATQGYDATSIREITRRADVNVAAAHYHFGSKEALLRGVTDRVVGPLNERRFELLDAVVATDRPTLAQAVEAFVRPDVEAIQRLGSRGPMVAHLLGRVYADRTPWIREMTTEQFGAAGERFLPVFAELVPHLSADRLAWRMQRVVAVIVDLFASWPAQAVTDAEADRVVADLAAFLTGALAAPVPDERGC